MKKFLLLLLCIPFLLGAGHGVDKSTLANVVISHEESCVHEGNFFSVTGYTTLAADGAIDFQVTTPNTSEWSHMMFNFNSTGAVVFTIYESAAVDADGAAVTPINNNRNSTNTSSLTIQTNGTVNTAGNAIYQQAWGYTNTPSKSVGGDLGAAQGIILKQNTTYRFYIDSNSADNIISYHGHWCEHTDKEPL